MEDVLNKPVFNVDVNSLTEVIRVQNDTINRLTNELEFFRKELESMKTNKNPLVIKPILLTELVKLKERELTSMECKGIVCHKRVLTHFIDWCTEKGIIFAHEVSESEVDEYYILLRNRIKNNGERVAKSTANNEYGRIKSVFEIGVKRKFLTYNVWEFKPLPQVKIKNWWTREYVIDLIKAIRKYAPVSHKHYYETIVRVLFATGLRITKLLGTKKSDMRVSSDGIVTIVTGKKVRGSTAITEHVSEISDPIASKMFLERAELNNEYCLIPDTSSPPKAYQCLLTAFGGREYHTQNNKYQLGICKKASMEWRSFHQAKHGYITERVIEGFSYEQIGKLVGNTCIDLLRQTYDHCVPADYIEDVRRQMQLKAIVI